MLHLCPAAMLIFPQKTITDENFNTKSPIYLGAEDEIKTLKTSKEKELSHDECHDNDDKNNCASFITMTLEITQRPAVIIMFINTFFFLAGTAVVFTHLLVYVEYQGVPRALGSLMISCLGFSSFAGRLGLSTLSQQPWTDTITLYIVAVFITGLCTVNRNSPFIYFQTIL